MEVVKLNTIKNTPRFNQIMQRSQASYDDIFVSVKEIMQNVKIDGDKALCEYTKKFDGVELKNLAVTTEEIQTAYNKVDDTFLEALKQSIKNITAVSQRQLPANVEQMVEPAQGVKVWKKWQPIEKVGLYVPGGKALYPSSVLMNAIPAKIAGCKKIMITTPPQKDGRVAPEILVAADQLGITDIFKIGGAQAIAALTYGTKTVPNVYKIVGPGNAYVAAAKLNAFVSGEVSIDSPAGPSEVFIIADETANPKFIAADLMCDTEHGDDSAAVLVTTSQKLAEQVVQEIKKNLPTLSTRKRIKKSFADYGLIATVETLEEAIDFANEYAPEHIQIMTRDVEKIAKKITNAGSIFVGEYTCKSAGDYATGANHVLPTGGSAKMFSGLSVLDFVKLVEYQSCTKEGLQNIRKTIETFAEVENLPAHKYSCKVRFES